MLAEVLISHVEARLQEHLNKLFGGDNDVLYTYDCPEIFRDKVLLAFACRQPILIEVHSEAHEHYYACFVTYESLVISPVVWEQEDLGGRS